MKKIKVGILFGGQSAEHEVSLQSAKNIIDAIDRQKYEVFLIGIDKSGKWYLGNEANFLLNYQNPKLISLNKSNATEISLKPGNDQFSLTSQDQNLSGLDVVFPVLHGPNGEDGTVQGLLKLTGIPFVGSDVLGSAVSMDKDIMKRLFRDAGLPIGRFKTLLKSEELNLEKIENEFSYPLFIKPANMGSSVGCHKVRSKSELEEAIKNAFQYDRKILIEEFIKGREIEVAVLGNEELIASIAGEVIPQNDFYSYEDKYIDEKGAKLEIPANIDQSTLEKMQVLAKEAFKVLNCFGLSRVDFFLKENNEIIINEVNSIPGFTKISMYPTLFGQSGISYSSLIDRLIQLGIERHQK